MKTKIYRRFVLGLMVFILPVTLVFGQTVADSVYTVEEQDNGKSRTIIRIGDNNVMTISESDDGVEIIMNNKELFKVTEDGNNVNMSLGNREILSVQENGEDTEVYFDAEELEEMLEKLGETLEEQLERMEHSLENLEIDVEDEEIEISSYDEDKYVDVIENEDNTTIKIGKRDLLSVTENNDTTRIRFGNKGVEIIEDSEGSSVRIQDIEKEHKEKKKNQKFEGHWAGVDIGMNNFVNEKFSMTQEGDAAFMDLHTGKSWNINLNIIPFDIKLASHLGLVTGLGINLNNYAFDQRITIEEDSEGMIVPVNLNEGSVIKSKLKMTYLTVPLLLEVQFGPAKSKKRPYIAGGVIGGLKIGSRTKVVIDNGERDKDITKDDFNLSPLRYGFTVRAGYEFINLYANYYAVPLFEKNKGPELYPIDLGLALVF